MENKHIIVLTEEEMEKVEGGAKTPVQNLEDWLREMYKKFNL